MISIEQSTVYPDKYFIRIEEKLSLTVNENNLHQMIVASLKTAVGQKILQNILKRNANKRQGNQRRIY